MTIRWITPTLGTAAMSSVGDASDVHVIDVRNLVDKAGNTPDAVRGMIGKGLESVSSGQRTVICCDYGMSRSNSIAVGVLAAFEEIGFEAALRRVQEATGETEIKSSLLKAVREAASSQVEEKKNTSSRAILVTGGSGFLGSSLVAAMGMDHRVIAPTRSQVDLASGSTQLDMMVGEEGVDCIVHLANPRVYTSNAALGESLSMLKNVIDVCIAREIRMIYPSNWEIYSGCDETLQAVESTPACPRGPYGETKYLSELLIDHNRDTSGLRCAVMRSSLVYGHGSDRPRFLYNFIEKCLRSETVVTHRYRNGKPSLDLMHIDDVVAALSALVDHEFEGSLNIGTGALTATDVIAGMIKAKTASSSRIEHVPIEASVASIAMDWSKAHSVLNWSPSVSIEVGLDHILAGVYKGQ